MSRPPRGRAIPCAPRTVGLIMGSRFRTPCLVLVSMLASVLAVVGCSDAREHLTAPPTATPSVCPPYSLEDSPSIPQPRADLLVGLDEEAAAACAKTLGWGFRVGSRDGESYALTADYSPMRITVLVKSGRVSSVIIG